MPHSLRITPLYLKKWAANLFTSNSYDTHGNIFMFPSLTGAHYYSALTLICHVCNSQSFTQFPVYLLMHKDAINPTIMKVMILIFC